MLITYTDASCYHRYFCADYKSSFCVRLSNAQLKDPPARAFNQTLDQTDATDRGRGQAAFTAAGAARRDGASHERYNSP